MNQQTQIFGVALSELNKLGFKIKKVGDQYRVHHRGEPEFKGFHCTNLTEALESVRESQPVRS